MKIVAPSGLIVTAARHGAEIVALNASSLDRLLAGAVGQRVLA
jgi:hypothetical protein